MGSLNDKVEKEIEQLKEFCVSEEPDRQTLIDYMRNTSLPFLACYPNELSASDSFRLSFHFLQALGHYNLPLALGICMNQYMAFCIAYLPLGPGSSLAVVRNDFLNALKDNHWLLAVSSFDDFARGKGEKQQNLFCKIQQDGSILCNGIKNFQSNISAADVLLCSGEVENKGLAFFYVFLNSTPGIEIGRELFPDAMKDSDTRSIHFENVMLENFQMIPIDSEQESVGLHSFTRVIFSIMAMAPYLGGAQRALHEARWFTTSISTDGKSLSELDGVVKELGCLQIKHQICTSLVERFFHSLQNLDSSNFTSWLDSESKKASPAKYFITAECESIVDHVRKLIGTRSMMPTHIISRLSQQILFGALHPIVNAKIEREMGDFLLHT